MRVPRFPLKFLALILLVHLNLNCNVMGQESRSSDESPKIYWVESITSDGKLVLREYSVTTTHILEFPELEIWSNSLGKKDPFSMYMGTIPDFKLKLLQSGIARLRDESSAPSQYADAQKFAKTHGYGMWPKTGPSPRLTATATPAAIASQPPAPSPTAQASPYDLIGEITSWNWDRIFRIFLIVLGLIGIAPLVKLFLLWRRRYQVPLIFVGLRSTGKSWLWNRISDPQITEDELDKIPPTEAIIKKKSLGKKPMGKYEIIPVYYDVAGGEAGQQATTLLEYNRRFWRLRRLLIPKKSVWLLMLATTQDKTVTINSPFDKKVEQPFISEQLGHLYLPLGVLSSKVTPKPNMVITCIGKFDLFAAANPNDTTARDAKNQLEEIFRSHLSRVRQECQAMSVPTEVVYCSAKKAWGNENILRLIEKALYP